LQLLLQQCASMLQDAPPIVHASHLPETHERLQQSVSALQSWPSREHAPQSPTHAQ
jgi:hypothetical protein